MSIKYFGDTDAVSKGLELLKNEFLVSGDKNVTISRCDCGFRAEVNGDSAEVAYSKPNDFFRAMSFVADAFSKGEKLVLEQKPSFSMCGIMLDASRNAVPKIETIKSLMKRMARMGLNELMLYTEDTYEIEEYPYFGYMRGRYTKAEIKEIVAYGNRLGIETIPCIQTLSHLAKALRWAAFGAVKESADILFVGEDETYRFIETMIKTCRECFTTDKIHIGMDEAHSVGLGRYLEKHGYRNRFSILSEHLAKVTEITKKYEFSPMMWSDMFFRLASSTGDYYDMKADLPENIKELIPDGVSQVYWDYYNHFEDVYDKLFEEHRKMGCPIIFAGGIWTWVNPSINYKQTFASTVPALKSCKKFGVENVIACLWGDDGAECDMHQALYGMQLYAENNYCDSVDEKDLNKAFKICCGCDAEMFIAFDIDDFGTEYQRLEKYSFDETENQILTITKQALYQNPLMGLFDKNHCTLPLKEHYEKLYDNFKTIRADNEWKELYECHLQLLRVMTKKCDIGNRAKSAYDNKNTDELRIASHILAELADEIICLKNLREKLWYKNNKPFGFETVSGRLSQIADLCDRASRRIEDYLEERISNIDELEQERLLFNPNRGEYVHMGYTPLIMIP